MRRLLSGGLVVGVVAAGVVALHIVMQAARLEEWETRCQSNLRTLCYGSLAYGGEWSEWLPTRVSARGGPLSGVYRLPILGFDTVTMGPGPYGSFAAVCPIGGWGYLMRDYLKNDFSVTFCPDSWHAKEEFLRPWDGRDYEGLYSEKLGYSWLVLRDPPTGVANGQRSVDTRADIARMCSGLPNLVIAADYVLWMGEGEGFRISGNHQPRKASGRPPSSWPAFDPYNPTAGPVDDRPQMANVCQLDARVSRKDFSQLKVYRYILDHSPRVYMW